MDARPHRVLIVEPTPAIAQAHIQALRRDGLVIEAVDTGAAARRALADTPADLVLLNLHLPGAVSGMDLVRELRGAAIPPQVVALTGQGSVQMAVDVMRAGASNVLLLPVGAERLRQAVATALADRGRAADIPAAAVPVEDPLGYMGFVGTSPSMRAVYRMIEAAAPSKATVFITGESGTGKEVCAEAIHRRSPRASQPFIPINCAAIPKDLMESEIFGHVKGAFTGATTDHAGAALQAHGGTLFLDEIGEISPAFQAKLLRVLQEGEFERVGGSRTLKVDVRLVTATNRNLEDAVSRGEFRADLYYRIAVVQMLLPPLRERTGDIPLLAREFLRRFNKENGTSLSLEPTALAVLADCHFPGNVRELENCIRRTATFARSVKMVGSDFACRNDVCLSAMLWQSPDSQAATAPAGYRPLPVVSAPPLPAASAPASLPVVSAGSLPPPTPGDHPPPPTCGKPCPGGMSERDQLIEAMETAGWVQAKAARLLGLTPRQIGYALRKHDIPIKRF